MDPSDTPDQTRALPAGVADTIRSLVGAGPASYRIELPRGWRRRATPQRSARPADLTIAAAAGGVWLDITGRAGILFDADQWAQLCVEAIILLLDIQEAAEADR